MMARPRRRRRRRRRPPSKASMPTPYIQKISNQLSVGLKLPTAKQLADRVAVDRQRKLSPASLVNPISPNEQNCCSPKIYRQDRCPNEQNCCSPKMYRQGSRRKSYNPPSLRICPSSSSS